MSLSAALSAAVSSLSAQSVALAAISENIANSSTTAYKVKGTSFEAVLSGVMSSGSGASTSGVKAQTSQAMLVQGTIASTSVDTNMAISGSGYFVVSDDPAAGASATAYSRNGSFTTDSDGLLVNSEGYYLMGYATEADGTLSGSKTLSNLTAIDVSAITSPAQATSTASLAANLPSNAAIGDSFTSSTEIFDSLGNSHNLEETWTKTAENSWTLTLSDPTSASDSTTATGTVSPSSFTLTFNESGSLASVSPSTTDDAAAIAFTVDFSTGAADAAITMDLGSIGGVDGLTQYSDTSSDIDIEVNQASQDGYAAGSLTGISIGDTGLVTATFENGASRAIYQIPLATFTNDDGLSQVSGTIYKATTQAGLLKLSLPGDGGGSLVTSALEGSTTDTSTEFNKMIIAQQAYSAASQVVTTANSMFDTLLQAVR
ncbi:flagellar hook protein FlgE [Caulobacter sp. NIBR1757]|uniref:flagellar hook protein FlgE n=1 Tax=Caulobacter sp. NIBR1757 TaxID=3016000 RepID=UPI0022EFDC9F|nr:flagellar hook protein FlgE [Caulobacter sp. NIBR1757]WGM40646.1 Flagellar hook protein FlgE [Caulobacter sp. NIBR1757]